MRPSSVLILVFLAIGVALVANYFEQAGRL